MPNLWDEDEKMFSQVICEHIENSLEIQEIPIFHFTRRFPTKGDYAFCCKRKKHLLQLIKISFTFPEFIDIFLQFARLFYLIFCRSSFFQHLSLFQCENLKRVSKRSKVLRALQMNSYKNFNKLALRLLKRFLKLEIGNMFR